MPSAPTLAATLARVILWFYPPAFRREARDPLVADVRRRAGEFQGSWALARTGAWLIRLVASLLSNAVAAWLEQLTPSSRRASLGRGGLSANTSAQPPARAPRALATRGGGFSSLDLKLGLRMLVKYPGLTIVGGIGIAVAIAIGGGFFAFAYAHFYPTIPLPDGDRLVGLENWDLAKNNEERRSIHDFVIWRDEMESVEDMTAFRDVRHNLLGDDGSVELISVAEITPSGFSLAQVPPLMGRALVEADAEPGARPVIVLGFDVWRVRFAADPDIVGEDVRLGETVHTVVGVMPEGFAFPMDHDFWTAMKVRPSDHPLGEGPGIFISARLAQGHDLRTAQAELSIIGTRMAAEFPETHGQFRAQIMPYVYPLLDVNQEGGKGFFWQFSMMNAVISLILIVICINVAVLVYARAATRRGEIAVRQALGASRRRIIGQMFVEALVLSVGAALLGLVVTEIGLHQAELLMKEEVGSPFWMNFGLSGPAVAYIFALTVVAAVITGVVPGVQATRKDVQWSLNRFSSANGPRLGRTWTTLVVIQVSVTVAALPVAVGVGWWEVREFTTAPTFPVDQFLAMGLESHPIALRSELSRRVEADPDVVSHGFMLGFPGGPLVRIGLEDEADNPVAGAGLQVRTSQVDRRFFDTVGAAVGVGRSFRSSDWDQEAAEVALVNRTLVDRYLGGGDAVGRRIHIFDENEEADATGVRRWIEIVGVVDDLHRNPFDDSLVEARVYRPLSESSDGNANLLIKTSGVDSSEPAGRIREIVAKLDPTLRTRIFPLARIYRQARIAIGLMALVLALAAFSVLLLSAAGIYALMSLTVSSRQREIGIRTALGAQPRRLLAGVFRLALRQIAAGVALGVVVAVGLDQMSSGELLRGHGGLLLSIMVGVMSIVGFLAAFGPARRGLRIDPTEALKGQ